MTQTQDSRTFVRPAAAAHYANVLVPLDGSGLAEAALGPARELGARFGAEVHTLTGAVHRDEIWWYARYQDRLRAGSAADGLAMHLSTSRAVPEGIIAMARDLAPCLVCMATHGRARSAAVLGSTFSHVMVSIDQPVLAVGPGFVPTATAPPPDRLVACLDGRPEAEQALPTAASWARRLGAGVTLLTAADPLLVRSWAGREQVQDHRFYAPSGDPEAYLATLAGLPLFDGLVVDRAVLWGLTEPAAAIGEHLDPQTATIAVAVTHGRTGLSRAALGSTVARMVRRSRVPLLVVPAPRAP